MKNKKTVIIAIVIILAIAENNKQSLLHSQLKIVIKSPLNRLC